MPIIGLRVNKFHAVSLDNVEMLSVHGTKNMYSRGNKHKKYYISYLNSYIDIDKMGGSF